jgi:hypothetical protein
LQKKIAHSNSKCDTLINLKRQSAFLQIALSVNLGVAYGNVLQLPEGGDFEALHYQPSINFDRSTKLHLTTEPPLLGSCC